MRTCFCAVQVNRLAEPFILVNSIIRMQQSIFWGKLSGKKMMCFYNPKVKFVDFIRELCLNILLLTHLPRSSPQQQAPGGTMRKVEVFAGKSPGLGAGESGSFVCLAPAIWGGASAVLSWVSAGRERPLFKC